MNRIIPPDSRSSFEIPRICRNGDFKQGTRNPSAARSRSQFNRFDAWGTAEFEGAFEIVEETSARAFQIIDGEVKELNGKIRRDDSAERAELADSKNDPF